MKKLDNFHGTSGGYGNHGCRCAECRTAHNQKQKDYNRRRKLNGDHRSNKGWLDNRPVRGTQFDKKKKNQEQE
jgi:hypothetical protein